MSRTWTQNDTSKWKEGFGKGALGAGVISSSSTWAGKNEGCSGTAGASTLTLAAAGAFADGMYIIIWQTRGTHNLYELNKIVSGGGTTTLTLAYPLENTYTDSGTNQAQCIQMLDYDTLTVNSGVTWSAPTWDGSKGSAIAVLCKTSFTLNGVMNLDTKGFAGGAGAPNSSVQTGEGNNHQIMTETFSTGGSGGGGHQDSGGAGGGNAAAGSRGYNGGSPSTFGGAASGNAALTIITPGGGGGGGSAGYGSGSGARGGGVAFIFAKTITINQSTGSITGIGGNGTSGGSGRGGGGGAGGSVLLKGVDINIGTSRVTLTGGSGGSGGEGVGGAGSTGRIHADYSKSFTGTSNPTIDTTLDKTIVPPGGAQSYLMMLTKRP